ncbi:MAG: nucleoside triphosphate pyrophosphohydrolase [Ruminococcus sp.]|nr:nucleoside triphosphate pyrophosphohydrolase [Ruminococcus sp.]
MIKRFNKLVRDKIPEILESNGQMCETEILSDERYLEMLEAKLVEECTEYQIDGSIEELVDIIEVIYAIAGARGVTEGELDRLRVEKATKNGRFKEKIFLKEVTEW